MLLNDVAHGQQVSKKVIVRGKKPFKITSVACDVDVTELVDGTLGVHVMIPKGTFGAR